MSVREPQPRRNSAPKKSDHKVSVTLEGPEVDDVVVQHWAAMWRECGVPEDALLADHATVTREFLKQARFNQDLVTVVARLADGTLAGSACCSVWSGPIPAIVKPAGFKVGTVWGVYVRSDYRRKGVATKLMQACISRWTELKCHKAVLLHASDAGRAVYTRVGFGEGNMLIKDLAETEPPLRPPIHGGTFTVAPAGAEADGIVARNWQSLWAEAGVSVDMMVSDCTETTAAFLAQARETLEGQTFVARDCAGRIVGSLVSQRWAGPIPLTLKESVFKLGTVWGVYVDKSWRRKGVGEAMMRACLDHWRGIGCGKGVLLYASEDGRRLYERLRFRHHNAMVLELPQLSGSAPEPPTVEALVSTLTALRPEVDASRAELLLRATVEQLHAVHGPDAGADANPELVEDVIALQRKGCLFVDPSDNWFTANLPRLGGGFDMKQLAADPAKLARKFDRLAPNYEAWTVGNRSVVMNWIARSARLAQHSPILASFSTVLDVACGVGLPGHTLRLCGCQAHLVGADISPGMIQQAERRKVFDRLVVSNANKPLPFGAEYADLIVCTGAMELLDRKVALAEFARILKPDGGLWVSFQWLGPRGCDAATAHQSVVGITEEQAIADLTAAGFRVEDIERCTSAFFTPTPSKDETLTPVPYLFVRCQRTPDD